MNKTIIIIIVILALLSAAGLGGYLVLSNRNQTSQTPTLNTSQTENTTQTTQNAEGKSIKDLLSSQGSQECSFSDEMGNSGTVFTANGKMRGDFVSKGPQGNVNSHMIADAQTARLWMDGQPTGFMMNISGLTSSEATTQGQVDLTKSINFDCKQWVSDTTKFVLPNDIEFQDMSALTTGASSTPEAGSSGTPVLDLKAQQCAGCNTLPSEYQAACKEAIGCN